MSRHFTPWDPNTDAEAEARGFNPPQTYRLWRDRLLPLIVFPIFWLYWLLLMPAGVARRRSSSEETRLGIESGKVGWTHVYFEELFASAQEYLGTDAIEQIVIDRDQPYLPQFRQWSSQLKVSHVLLDVRTGAQTWPRALVDVLVMSWRLRRARVTPVVVLTDASLRRHRLQAAVLTAFSGVVVTFMSSSLVRPMFPHSRILGPMPMPVSASRLRWLDDVRSHVLPSAAPTVSFIGGAYPPRSVFLERLASALQGTGVELTIHANKYETSNDDYWRVLATSDVIITTTMQGMPRADMDRIWIQQLVFRFSEALSAGAVLVSSTVAGGDRFFVPGEDYAPFVSVAEARDVLVRLCEDSDFRERLRSHGHETAVQLAREHTYWRAIDQALGLTFAMNAS